MIELTAGIHSIQLAYRQGNDHELELELSFEGAGTDLQKVAAISLRNYTHTSSLRDGTPPTAPLNLSVVNTGTREIGLSWEPATDNIAVEKYFIYGKSNAPAEESGNEWQLVDSTSNTNRLLSGLIPDTDYLFLVRAQDHSRNLSGPSNEVSAKTLSMNASDPHFISFYYDLTDRNINLYWETAPAGNIKTYSIEKSFDGALFSKLDSLPAIYSPEDTLTYTYEDRQEPAGLTTFYRVVATDSTGNLLFSSVLEIEPDYSSPDGVSVLPNPIRKGKTLYIYPDREQFPSLEKVEVQLINSAGQVVYRIEEAGPFTLNTRMLEPGIYLIVIANLNSRASKRFLVINP